MLVCAPRACNPSVDLLPPSETDGPCRFTPPWATPSLGSTDELRNALETLSGDIYYDKVAFG